MYGGPTDVAHFDAALLLTDSSGYRGISQKYSGVKKNTATKKKRLPESLFSAQRASTATGVNNSFACLIKVI